MRIEPGVQRSVVAAIACASVAISGCVKAPSQDPAAIPPDPSATYDVSLVALQDDATHAREIVATFSGGAAIGPLCTQEVISGCTVTHCAGATRAAAPASAVDPGAITVTSVSLGKVAVPLDGGVGLVSQPGGFGDGEVIELQSTGGADLPAFDETVLFPAEATGFSLDGCGAGGACTLSQAGPLARWSGGSGANVVVVFATAPASDSSSTVSPSTTSTITCTFEGSMHQGQVPESAMETLGSGARATATFTTQTSPTVVVGSTHRLGVFVEAMSADNVIDVAVP